MLRPTSSKAQFATLFLLSVVIGCTTCKLVESSINLATYSKQDTWKYINKFGYSTGEGEYRIRFRFTAPSSETVTGYHPVRLYIYLDDNWPKVLASNSCEEKIGHASVDLKVNIPNNGDWSETATGNIRQWMRPHVWFFALGDCHGEGAFTEEILNNGNGRLQFELRTLNPDGSEFSVEEQGFGTPYICIMVYLVLFLCTNLNRLRMIYKREEGEIDMAFFTLILAIIVELISIVLEFAHISVYSVDGQGIPSADFASQVASVFSQFIMTCLLVLIAWGWTLSFQELKAWYCYVPIGVLVGILQITMVGLTRIAHDDASKYHEYDNWAGLLIVLLRVGLFGYFSNGIRDTKTKSAESAKSFATKFGVVGSFYLLAFPALVAITAVAAPYVRHKIITIGTIVAQTVGMAFLAYSFGSKDSEYNSVNIRNTRLILPCSGKFDKLD